MSGFFCGGPRAEVAPGQGVVILTWVCPMCEGEGGSDHVGPCPMCHGRGAVDDDQLGEWSREDLKRTAVPPAVMKSPCADCAFRPGSPEDGALPSLEKPFMCHHGMPVVGGGYAPTAWAKGMPLGAMVCRGWWDAVTSGAFPAAAYRPARDGWGTGTPRDVALADAVSAAVDALQGAEPQSRAEVLAAVRELRAQWDQRRVRHEAMLSTSDGGGLTSSVCIDVYTRVIKELDDAIAALEVERV